MPRTCTSTSSGYVPTSVVLIMEKRMLGDEVHTQFVEDVDISDAVGLVDIARLEGASPSLDCRRSEDGGGRHGPTVRTKRDGRSSALPYCTPIRGGGGQVLSVKALIADPGRSDQREIFNALLDRCEQASASMGKDHVLIRLSALSPDLYQHMLSRSYLLKGANVRMVKKGTYEENGKYHITSWAG